MNIMIAGEGGQGIQAAAKILSDSAYDEKYNVTYIPHYGVEMRMGISFAYVKISKKSIAYPKFDKADILAVLAKREIETIKRFISKETRVINLIDIINKNKDININSRSLNIFALGIIVKNINALNYNISSNTLRTNIRKVLKEKNITDNLHAYDTGINIDEKNYDKNVDNVSISVFKPLKDEDKEKSYIRFPSLCKACGLCIEKCPVKALSTSESDKNYFGRNIPKVDINKCIACQICENVCPDSAIKVQKKK